MSSFVHFVNGQQTPYFKSRCITTAPGIAEEIDMKSHWSMRPKWLDSGVPIEAILSPRLSAVTR